MCDRATVLRDGRDVGILLPPESSEEAIVDLMLGPAAEAVEVGAAGATPENVEAVGEPHAAEAVRQGAFPPDAGESGPLLEIRDLRVGNEINGVSLQVHPGEVVGVAALEGQGQDALFDALAGRRRSDGGEIRVENRIIVPRTPYDAIRAGVVLVPGDRVQALLPQRPVRENIATPLYNRILRWGVINRRDESRRVVNAIQRLQIDTRAQRQVRRLSGGNQQKVTIGRWLATGFQVLLLFDPTRGIDVGTKRQIHTLLRELVEGGIGILLFTSELPEIQLVCDRVLVLYEGRIVQEMPADKADEAALLRAAHGLTREEARV